jgi:hypothetical protein
MGWWILRDVQVPLSHIDRPVIVTPLTISATRRDYPSVSENRGKWFVSSLRSQGIPLGVREGNPKGGGFTWIVWTARHVISDTWYNYQADQISLTSLYHLSWDLASAGFSGQVATGDMFRYTSGLSTGQALMAQYRNNNRSRLTWLIVSSDTGWAIIDLPVLPGDSGSPVIFSDKKLGVVSQSRGTGQAVVQKINRGIAE